MGRFLFLCAALATFRDMIEQDHPMQPTQQKPPLPHEVLTDVIRLTLWAGQLLLQYGAESARIEETAHHIGTGLGCNWLDIFVLPEGLLITTISGEEFRTKARRVTRLGVNFAIVDAVNDVSRRVYEGSVDRFELRRELRRISDMSGHYNRWFIVAMVGLGCAAFNRLFGGDPTGFAITFVAASSAMFIRQELEKRYLNFVVVTLMSAFVAGVIASMGYTLDLSDNPQLALAASVLLLIPGVPLINAAEDLIQGHIASGIARGVMGGIITLAIAVGLTLAIMVTGISGL
jgi:uncharacterized membrane protein YjjP (DUF1212 family)